MIWGIGIDVVNVDRLERWDSVPGLLERYFHPKELATGESRKVGRLYSLAARFAAKEAFGKALGTGLSGFSLRDIFVTNDEAGKPSLHLTGKAQDVFEKKGGGRIFVSLTHERDYAIATVIIEEKA
ncbi:MAG: holo-ACP synthase [Spirochaetaceae bacterium]|nr:MAG: holo-ACP synthase [Spirochaetaceae bacterium]